MSSEIEVREFYEDYYRRKGADRNDLTNPGALFQALALEASMVNAVARVPLDPKFTKVLDVGCGGGGAFFQFFRLRYQPENLTGIDLHPDRLSEARRLHMQSHFVHGNASRMEFDDASFDVIYESTMFATLVDDGLCSAIASEMLRVCRPNGYLLLVDWSFPRRTSNYYGLTRRRLRELFEVGTKSKIVAVFPGALVPPVGRFLSRFAPFAYFSVQAFCPFLVGQVAYLLQRTAHDASDSHRQTSKEMPRSLKEESTYVEAAA